MCVSAWELQNKIDKKFEMKIEKNNFVFGLKASRRLLAAT
jgi:hypothetical protein